MGNKKTKESGGGAKTKGEKPSDGKQIPSNPSKEAKQYKVLMIGDSGVGKSSVLVRYFEDKWEEGAVQSLSSEVPTQKDVVVNGRTISLLIWDTGGQERFRYCAIRKIFSSNSLEQLQVVFTKVHMVFL